MEIADIRQRLERAGLHPSKDRGQNFLLDESVIDDMIKAAQVTDKDVVVEIGPGLGVLTEKLSSHAHSVFAMELDHGLARELTAQFLPKHANVTLFEGDALSKAAYHAKVEWLDKRPYKVVANLPYQITSKLMRDFMESTPMPQMVVVMVQKEVAQRATAKPGDFSLLGLSIQVYSEATIVRTVPAKAFFPKPEVDSAVLKCDLTKPNAAYTALTTEQREAFWRLARLGFSSRRKQLKNNLGKPFKRTNEEMLAIFANIGIGQLARAQELTIEQWCALTKALS